MEMQKLQNTQNTLTKKKNSKTYTTPFQDFYIATVIKQCGTGKNQINRTEDPEIYLHLYGQFVFSKSAKAIYWEKKSFQQVVLEKLISIFLN